MTDSFNPLRNFASPELHQSAKFDVGARTIGTAWRQVLFTENLKTSPAFRLPFAAADKYPAPLSGFRSKSKRAGKFCVSLAAGALGFLVISENHEKLCVRAEMLCVCHRSSPLQLAEALSLQTTPSACYLRVAQHPGKVLFQFSTIDVECPHHAIDAQL